MDGLIGLSEAMVALARKLHLAEIIEDGLQGATPEQVRKILRWLRNLQATDKETGDWLELSSPEEREAKLEQLHQLLVFYAVQLRDAAKKYPSILRDPGVVDAHSAAAALAYTSLEFALDTLPEGHPDIAKLEATLTVLPQSFELRANQSLRRLVDTLAHGIERASGLAADDRSPADRLLEISGKIHAAANKLRSIDTLETPAREESIELAREILRKLKNLGSSDKTLRQLADTGRPGDKAALAETIEEMVDSYRQLLQEAAKGNPDIMEDPRIKEANDAVGGFAHGIKLMAAKEIPGSAAASQQISADITQMPEEWRHMENRTMERLMQSMDGGLEKTAQDLQAQQEAQERAEEQSQSAADAHLSSDSRRRKRRRQTTGIGGAKQQRVMREINADDYVLKQGRFSESDEKKFAPKKPAAPMIMPGLAADAMDAVKALGSSLRNIGKEAANLPPPPAEEPKTQAPDNPLTPGTDQPFVQQVKEQRSSTRPRSSGNRPSGNSNRK